MRFSCATITVLPTVNVADITDASADSPSTLTLYAMCTAFVTGIKMFCSGLSVDVLAFLTPNHVSVLKETQSTEPVPVA